MLFIDTSIRFLHITQSKKRITDFCGSQPLVRTAEQICVGQQNFVELFTNT